MRSCNNVVFCEWLLSLSVVFPRLIHVGPGLRFFLWPILSHSEYSTFCLCSHWWLSSVQSLSCVWLCNPMDYSMPGFPVHRQFPELVQTHVHRISDSDRIRIFPSIRVFSNESVLCIRWPKYWSFSFKISPSNEYSGLIFRIDWFDLLAVQGTLKSLLQHHSSWVARLLL